MTNYEAASLINSSQSNLTTNLNVRLFGLGRNFWISTEMYQNAACDMAIFLEECGLHVEKAKEIANLDYSFEDANGFASYCLSNGVMDWGKFGLISDLLDSMEEEAVEAACELQMDVSTVEDSYLGHYESLRKYLEESFDEIDLPSIPPAYHGYLDYDAIYRDREAEFNEQNGYIFRA